MGCFSVLNVQETNPMLQMASVYGVQQTAKQAPAFLFPKCAEVSEKRLYRFLCHKAYHYYR